MPISFELWSSCYHVCAPRYDTIIISTLLVLLIICTPFYTAKTTMPEHDGVSCTLSVAPAMLVCTISDESISGIQIIVQSSDLEECEKLNITRRFDPMAEIMIPIEVDGLTSGTYQVTVLGIGTDTGMIDSVLYIDILSIQTISPSM